MLCLAIAVEYLKERTMLWPVHQLGLHDRNGMNPKEEHTEKMNRSPSVYFLDLLFEHFSTVVGAASRGYPSDEDFRTDGFQGFLDTSPVRNLERGY